MNNTFYTGGQFNRNTFLRVFYTGNVLNVNKVVEYMAYGVKRGIEMFNIPLPKNNETIENLILNFEPSVYQETLQYLYLRRQNPESINETVLTFVDFQIERIVNALKNTFVKIPDSTRVINIRNKESKPAWFIIKYPKLGTSNNNVKFEEIDIPGMAEPLSDSVTWKLRWEQNITPNILPSAITQTIRGRTNSITQQRVGKYCNSQTFQQQNPWCGKSRSFKYNEYYNSSTNQSTITKSGKSGLGVTELAKLLFETPPEKKRRRYYLDLKRNGDYGQIFSCRYLIENDPNNYKAIMHPGSRELAERILKNEVDSQKLINLMNKGSFFFMNATFCSFDRPAAKFAQLMRIPLLYEKPVDKKCYFQVVAKHEDIRNLITQSTTKSVSNLTGKDIMNIVNFKYIEEGGALPGPNRYPMWYQLMCIIDTAHDFRGRRLPQTKMTPFQQRTAIKNLMAGLYVSGTTVTQITTQYGTYSMPDLIKVIFDRITDVEEAASDDLVKFSNIYSRSAIPPLGSYFTESFGASFNMQGNETTSNLINRRNGVTTLDDLLARINSCIVLDATSRKLPLNLRKRISFLSAKFIDPGT